MPRTLVVLGVSNVVFAAFGIFGDVRALTWWILQQIRGTSTAGITNSPGQQTIFLGLMLLGIGTTVLLGASGVGLLRRKLWGRWLAMIYAGYLLVATPITFAFQYPWHIAPAVQQANEISPKFGEVIESEMRAKAAAVVLASVVAVAYASILLVAMTRRSIVAALQAASKDGQTELRLDPPESQATLQGPHFKTQSADAPRRRAA